MDNRVLVKLRPSAALGVSASRSNLRPLHDATTAAGKGFGAVDQTPQWFVAEVRDGAETPWDLAHARLADQLGIDASDVIFAEPDLRHDVFPDGDDPARTPGFAVGDDCDQRIEQDGTHGKGVGPSFAWHLGDTFTQLGRARDAVRFDDQPRRTRIAHLDTGYYPTHVTRPPHIVRELERNFVPRDTDAGSATDPDNFVFGLDNSGHGTGTIGILAGNAVAAEGGLFLGGAYDAEIVPLRIADSVVMLRTSAFAQALRFAVDHGCDVGTLSMGGLPSRAWNDEVDHAYESGFCLVAAAGNNVNAIPTRHIVYPARYRRVIAVCGVMADGRPYADLDGLTTMEGNFGPDSRMTTAMAAYTPNIPWPRFGCRQGIRLNGEGTSSATPQVAAAAALWFEKYKHELPRDWRRVEAVRRALFSTAKDPGAERSRLGNGILQAFAALQVRPVLTLSETPRESDSFAFWRVLTGLGIDAMTPREEMFNLELAQRWLVNRELQELVPDPDHVASLDPATLRRVMDAVIGDDGASRTLRRHVAGRYPSLAGGAPAARTERTADVVAEVLPACGPQPAPRNPPYRRLRAYAVDPSFSTKLATASANEVTLPVRWESLTAGPTGEYFAVEDVDAAGTSNEPVNLDDPTLLAQDGWEPSAGNPQFHQQMVYAVAMRTVEHFERALGRPILWRHRPNPKDPYDDADYVPTLKIHPHKLAQANAFYSPRDVALQFGYFEAAADDAGDHVPGTRVYSCLSHDIIAHETTHAVLDGMHQRFNEPTNPDVLAFHEGFADVVALMQHFTIREIVAMEIGTTRGNLEAESVLGSLAVEFGRASGRKGALRNAIGTVENGVWKRLKPDPAELARRLTPHTRGSILVAAVFDAFLAIYKARTADLVRLATGGTGILPDGAIHPDLVDRLAREATTAAGHVLTMCIRALDYLPPVDVTFFEYLRALITADTDFVSEDRYSYRVAFVEAFRRRGIYPIGIDNQTDPTRRTVSVETLRWQGIDAARWQKASKPYGRLIRTLKQYANACLYLEDRAKLFRYTRRQRAVLREQLGKACARMPELAEALYLEPDRSFEVHHLRAAMRTRSDGRHVPQAIVTVTQTKTIPADPERGMPAYAFRGGSTLVVDLLEQRVKYQIYKKMVGDERRREIRTAEFARRIAADPLLGVFVAPSGGEPFAALHALEDAG